MDRVEGISGFPSVSDGAAAVRAMALHAIARAEAVAPVGSAGTPPTGSGELSASQIQPGRMGGAGRFETLILAVQALHLGYGTDERPTARVEEMRAAAEEIFHIDGLPQPVLPAVSAVPDISAPSAERSAGTASSPAPTAAPTDAVLPAEPLPGAALAGAAPGAAPFDA